MEVQSLDGKLDKKSSIWIMKKPKNIFFGWWIVLSAALQNGLGEVSIGKDLRFYLYQFLKLLVLHLPKLQCCLL